MSYHIVENASEIAKRMHHGHGNAPLLLVSPLMKSVLEHRMHGHLSSHPEWIHHRIHHLIHFSHLSMHVTEREDVQNKEKQWLCSVKRARNNNLPEHVETERIVASKHFSTLKSIA